MTVKELIELLKTMPQDMKATYNDSDFGICDINEVYVSQEDQGRWRDGAWIPNLVDVVVVS